MKRNLMIGLLCGGLAGCAMPYGTVPFGAPPPGSSLRDARQACNTNYPPRVGNYLPHAQCVNAAVEAYAVPVERYPDLIRLQEQARSVVSGQIDNRAISVKSGERRMAEADSLVEQARRDRDAGRPVAADEKIARLNQLMQQ